MSVTFSIEGARVDWQTGEGFINLANTNARELLRWLGLPNGEGELSGDAPAAEIAARCRRRLWPEARNEDPGVPATREGRVIDCGRRPGYLPEKVALLLALCEGAGDRRLTWG